MFSTKSIHSVTRDSFDPSVPFAATALGVRMRRIESGTTAERINRPISRWP